MCILLTSDGLQMPVLPCANCATGPESCNTGQKCKAAVITNGEATPVFAEESMVVDLVTKEMDCYVDLNLLAIGGGGRSTSKGGAGSGYIETTTMRLATNNSTIKVTVGDCQESSTVEVGGTVVLDAKPGESTGSGLAGDGYSGGGGGGGNGTTGKGGLHGGDGEDTLIYRKFLPGGKGSGFDLGLITMKNFVLGPGEGGLPGDYHRSGGGGGVVVNGKKPGGIKYRGQGYGGGGSNEGGDVGYSGLVLIEVTRTVPIIVKIMNKIF